VFWLSEPVEVRGLSMRPDLAATFFWRFGLDPRKEMSDLTGRPYKLADGQPIERVFA
jgi:hypothetical protein